MRATVMVGVRRKIPVEVTPQLRRAVEAYVTAPTLRFGRSALRFGLSDQQIAALAEARTAVDCPQPHCRVKAGELCINPQGHPMRGKVHTRRVDRAHDALHQLVAEARS